MSCNRKMQYLVLVLFMLLSGCVFYPKQIEYYTDCNVKAKKLVLKTEAMKGSCSTSSGDPEGKGCLAGLLALGAASAVVSGSIVVVGNTVYWLEKEGKCLANADK